MTTPITLGELIHDLSLMPADMLVRLDGIKGEAPGTFCSWRGIYSHLTLGGWGDYETTGALLAGARAADGATFAGYKGGDYIMGPNTFVWADYYGECPGRAVTGLQVRKTPWGDVAILMTEMLDIYK